MEKALASASWTDDQKVLPYPGKAPISWPVVVSAGIWNSVGPAPINDVYANISEWLKTRHAIDVEPGQSTQNCCDEKKLVCAHFATKNEGYWSIRYKSGHTALDITAISGKQKTQINISTRSNLIGHSEVDLFQFLCRRFIVEQDGVQLHDRPQLASIKNVGRLVDFIEKPERKLPVVVVSLNENERRIDTAAVDPFILARKLVGVAHVIVVPGDETYALSTRFGKELSAYHGAIRVYGSGFHPDGHASKLTTRLRAFEDTNAAALLQDTCHAATRLLGQQDQSIGFDDVYSLDSQAREVPQAGAADVGDTIHLLRRISELETALEKRTASLQIAEARIAKLQKSQGASSDTASSQHRTAMEVAEWASRQLSGLVDVPKKAQKSTKGSSLKDLDTLRQALSVLGNEYRAMRLSGGKESVQCLDRVLAALHLEIAPVAPRVVDSARSKLTIDTSDRRLIADQHVRNKTNPHDPTKCIRIYFAWDEARKIAVVASLPTYLG